MTIAANTDRNEVAQRMIAQHGRDEALASATRLASSCVTPGFRALFADVAALLRLETQSDETEEQRLDREDASLMAERPAYDSDEVEAQIDSTRPDGADAFRHGTPYSRNPYSVENGACDTARNRNLWLGWSAGWLDADSAAYAERRANKEREIAEEQRLMDEG